MDSIDVLRAREEEVAREWQWLNDTLYKIASARADEGELATFRLMQAQALLVGQRRNELRIRMAALEEGGRYSIHPTEVGRRRCAGDPSLGEARFDRLGQNASD